ncbi:hypothetical protein FGSG_10902 [Fusarium graminearum PH-1]|uniref:CBF1-interacting co-repressor CIR N-terminal domain-containing protein n=1 Tax=Gibberella zeae (strain ATCC MYA-4620 / CBS 123657 / FGSC 9075 / NRRL 31084 / PH-1) TaxID=229533 RepID=I1S2B5_GIBZE|nr:hypothetical protein FGSG_10902 [Fusarium graminearum PH-1]ESU17856.1 hypothetical protein FGSG_10902 [Fusarium graminearum PH-1]EYB28896.1 hypothetical protein FG05_10902 [Fusarium graminearum]|eukprot:XP_011325478.1 hypothetical protein FGSG_10902 [Fusarium graminearum PH-1]
MPLHLLGKKSWNVYNADNVARVRRDEAAAKAAEEGEEQRMQEIDAQRRLAILRGEEPPPIEEPESPKPNETSIGDRDASHRGPRRKRKRPDEDDTDFEMRIARENENKALMKTEPERKSTSSAPIVDHNGHIDLLGDEKSRAHAEKNEEAEKEAKKKKQSYEDQFMMRLSNASGKDGVLRPWYSQADAAAPDASSKDVWGNQDPNRRDRDAKRVASNDPLAMMKQGASKVRTEVEIDTEAGTVVVIERDHRIAMSEDNGLKSEGMIVIDTMIHGVEDMSVMTENGLGMGEGATTRMNHEEKGVDKIKNTTRNKTCDLEKEEIKNDDKVVMNCDSDQHTLLTTFYTVIHEAV